jgi:hypothetical protein
VICVGGWVGGWVGGGAACNLCVCVYMRCASGVYIEIDQLTRCTIPPKQTPPRT